MNYKFLKVDNDSFTVNVILSEKNDLDIEVPFYYLFKVKEILEDTNIKVPFEFKFTELTWLNCNISRKKIENIQKIINELSDLINKLSEKFEIEWFNETKDPFF